MSDYRAVGLSSRRTIDTRGKALSMGSTATCGAGLGQGSIALTTFIGSSSISSISGTIVGGMDLYLGLTLF